ncbi:phosphatidylserine lipase ABHD16A isoform X2 [Prorops nasuta]|uniref:phosphatidylserine lipase ABHD16A isoform X2 n=1 Tax=Prorops nasuta TaxID=863751 RepID=UPI0034CE288C
MSLIKTLWRCVFSPRLYSIYEVTSVGRLIDKSYEPRSLERWGDQIVVSFATMWSISIYATPLVAIFMYQRSYPLADNMYILSKLVLGTGLILFASLAARGCSRASNPVYLKFVKTLNDAKAHYNYETKQELQKYDFEFWAWPIDYKIPAIDEDQSREKLTLRKIGKSNSRIRRQGRKEFILTLPCKFVSFIVAHTFAIKMMYPGSISIMNWVLRSTLLKGRIDLIKQGAERFKLITADNNQIDAIFIDRRNKSTNGNILVITCEGNCGFYENGIITTPLSKGYSLLGWNHPGFGCSTGAPYPIQEENAIDCIMRFAIDHLKFQEQQIILFGWSIGGYTATWAAMNYPSIKSLILDATFDDVLPLAYATMSSSLEGIVRNVIRDYLNLNIAEQLNRRTEDEIICTPSNVLAGNRGNMLLTKLLIRRYPHLFSDSAESAALLAKYLGADSVTKKTLIDMVKVDEKYCLELIKLDNEQNGGVRYPSTLGQNLNSKSKEQLTIFLATMYMKDQSSSHCVPLNIDLFQPGWNPATI